MRPADELRDAVEAYLRSLLVRARARRSRGSTSLLARVRGQAHPTGPVPRCRRRGGWLDRRRASRSRVDRARAHLLVGPRRLARDGRRRRATWPREHVGRVRRGRCAPRRRRAPRGGAAARAQLRVARDRARARRRDARDDRRPVPRHHGRRRRPRGAASPQDGPSLRRRRAHGSRGRSGARSRARAPGSRSETRSVSSSRSSTTSSTATATRNVSGARAPSGLPTRPPSGRAHTSTPSGPRRSSCVSSSTCSRFAPVEGSRSRDRRVAVFGYRVTVQNRPGRRALRLFAPADRLSPLYVDPPPQPPVHVRPGGRRRGDRCRAGGRDRRRESSAGRTPWHRRRHRHAASAP